MAVPLRPGHRIEVRNKLRLILTAEGVFEGVKRRCRVVSDRNSPPFGRLFLNSCQRDRNRLPQRRRFWPDTA